MADLPILFIAPMVRAIWREIESPGTGKTMTRRVITPENFRLLGHDFRFHRPDRESLEAAFKGARDFRWIEGAFSWLADPDERMHPHAVAVDCRGQPKFAPSDRLWVRETWAVGNIYDGMPPSDINPDGKPGWCGIRYAATDARNGIKDRSSRFMPRWASRITLIVKDARVERLQDISEANAISEGVIQREDGLFAVIDERRGLTGATPDAVSAFAMLWDAINGPGAWEANPWVTVTSFKPHLQNIDLLEAA